MELSSCVLDGVISLTHPAPLPVSDCSLADFTRYGHWEVESVSIYSIFLEHMFGFRTEDHNSVPTTKTRSKESSGSQNASCRTILEDDFQLVKEKSEERLPESDENERMFMRGTETRF